MSNLYESITTSDGINDLKAKILGELGDNNMDDETRVNALTASTSMGFNSLFDILSKMTANAYVLEAALAEANEDNLSPELATVAKDVCELIKNIGLSVENDKVRAITDNLKVLMERVGAFDESTTDSESN